MRIGNFGERLWDAIFRPKIDEQALNAALGKARAAHPPPVVWLLGKTQAGKTSIIRSLTGSPDAEIGNGFQSCTKTARFYDHPMDLPIVRFLDTQGLGEVAYDPSEDIAFCESQAHLIIAVIKAGDSLQDAVFGVLRTVRERHPEWPVIIVQSCLHEVYSPGVGHVQPYPFTVSGWESSVPGDLARCLLFQRNTLGVLPGKGPVHWVPVDLTLPEDGFSPPDYGLESLWAAIEQASAMQLENRLRGDRGVRDLRQQTAHQHIVGYAKAAVAVGALPMVDLAMIPALQMKMLHSLGEIHGGEWNKRRISEFGGLLGGGFLAGYGLRLVGRSAIKVIPGYGQTLGAAYGAVTSAAVTFALGKTASYYLECSLAGKLPGKATLRDVFNQALNTGKGIATSFLGKEQA
ncbi:YcjF family protein [Desulfonatronum lacustre]|uniref:YcjF family protein n=1 Tax=Desulfonatronum lacustre TaxID=66849 RepID=UPI00146FA602|nr:GTPase [Desulfonatronum lacustre]